MTTDAQMEYRIVMVNDEDAVWQSPWVRKSQVALVWRSDAYRNAMRRHPRAIHVVERRCESSDD